MERYFGNAYRGDPGVPHSGADKFISIWIGSIAFSAITWYKPYIWQLTNRNNNTIGRRHCKRKRNTSSRGIRTGAKQQEIHTTSTGQITSLKVFTFNSKRMFKILSNVIPYFLLNFKPCETTLANFLYVNIFASYFLIYKSIVGDFSVINSFR